MYFAETIESCSTMTPIIQPRVGLSRLNLARIFHPFARAEYPRQNKRPSPRGRSADFQSAVSPICNRQSVQKPSARGLREGRQNTILRYSRLKICATTYEISGLSLFGLCLIAKIVILIGHRVPCSLWTPAA